MSRARESDGGTRQRVRIIGGRWRRRQLAFPDLSDLRPTADRVRETLFNWLGQDLTGLDCLDLFAGSGALGFEAASRGARRVVLVEQERAAVRALQDNARLLGATELQVIHADAQRWLERAPAAGAEFDVVFLDPPFRLGLLPGLLARVRPHLREGGCIYVESPAVSSWAPDAAWTVLRQARAGAVDYRLVGLAATGDGQHPANPDTLAA